jgi:SAM-dependent methyltransferase
MEEDYVHGYSEIEAGRLHDQAQTLAQLLHGDTRYQPDTAVLEIGCGVGAQTAILARNSPLAQFTAIDVSDDSVKQARKLLTELGCGNVDFVVADVFDLTFAEESFDHLFVCFLLEHLADPLRALANMKKVLKKGGSLTVIEGDHGSCFFHPDSPDARFAVNCLIQSQAAAGGDALIGRKLYPILQEAGFSEVTVSPRMVYADGNRPDLVEGFTKSTFTAMVAGAREKILSLGLANEERFDKGIKDLYRTAEPDGVFCYTFFKALAFR